MCRKAWPLVRLEHSVPKRVLFRQLKIWLHLDRVDERELRVGRPTMFNSVRTCHEYPVRTRHFAAGIHQFKRVVSMGKIKPAGEINLLQWNGRAEGIDAAAGDVGTAGFQHRILEQVIRGAIFLKDNDNMLDFGAVIAASIQAKQNSSSDG